MKKKLLVVGTLAYDSIETPYSKVSKILGGASTYIVLAASKFSINCGLVSVIGKDFKKEYISILESHNINCDGVELIENGKTFFWSGKYHQNMNSRTTIKTELNVLENFLPKIPKNYINSELLMIGNLHPDVQLEILNQSRNKKKFVILDTMNIWIENFRDTLKKVISKSNLISVNDEEARLLTNEYSLFKAANKILKMGPKYIIIKKGEHGSILFSKDKLFIIPAFPVKKVVDPTGAGDSYVGGIAGYLSNHKINFENIKNAIVYGTIFSSFTVESFGIDSLEKISKNDIFERLKEFKNLTSVKLDFNKYRL